MVAIGILLIVICVVLGFFVLIQNPKGGGLAGNFGGLGQQMMGVQQSTDTVEKGTWILAGIMGVLCILLVAFNKTGTQETGIRSTEALKNAKVSAPAPPAPTPGAAPASAPGNTAPAQAQTAPAQAQAAPAQTAPTSPSPAPATK